MECKKSLSTRKVAFLITGVCAQTHVGQATFRDAGILSQAAASFFEAMGLSQEQVRSMPSVRPGDEMWKTRQNDRLAAWHRVLRRIGNMRVFVKLEGLQKPGFSQNA